MTSLLIMLFASFMLILPLDLACLFFSILSLVRLFIFSKLQNTFIIITIIVLIIRMQSIYLITLQRTLEENVVEQMGEYWKGITE